MGQPGIFSQLATVDGIRTVEGIRGEWKRWGWGGARQKSEDDEVEYYNSDSHSVPGFYFQERILRIGNLFDLTEAKGLQGTCTTNFLPLTPSSAYQTPSARPRPRHPQFRFAAPEPPSRPASPFPTTR